MGHPEKKGEIDLETGTEVVSARIARSGIDLAVVTAETVESIADHPLSGLTIQNVQWKQIPSASKGEPPAVNRLVTSVTRDIGVELAYRVHGDVDLFRSAADPIAVFEPTSEVTGYLVECSWTLDREEDAVLHRFEEQ